MSSCKYEFKHLLILFINILNIVFKKVKLYKQMLYRYCTSKTTCMQRNTRSISFSCGVFLFHKFYINLSFSFITGIPALRPFIESVNKDKLVTRIWLFSFQLYFKILRILRFFQLVISDLRWIHKCFIKNSEQIVFNNLNVSIYSRFRSQFQTCLLR